MLEARSVSVRFGGVTAVAELSLVAASNSILGLVGPNGSGKSTFLNAVSGIVPATGQVSLDGVELPMGRPRHVRRMGVMRAFQAPQLVPELEVLDNVLLADPDHTATHIGAVWLMRRWLMRHERGRWQRANEALELVGLADHTNAEPESLSYGYRRLVELARVIAAEPRVVLLDEPAAGLNASETSHLADIITQLRDRGITVLLVEHKIDFVDRLCDRIVVLNQGVRVAEGPPTEVWRDEQVIEAYLGSV